MTDSSSKLPIPNRVYEHYRGNRYMVIAIARNADEDGAPLCVVYRALYGEGQLYTTSLARFVGNTEAGTPRFRLLAIEEVNPNHTRQ